MNKLKNIIDKLNWKFITYLLYAIIAVSFLSTNTFATYSSTAVGTGEISVAKFYYGASLGDGSQTSYQVSAGEDIVIPIEISNSDASGNGSQVALSYSIAVISNGYDKYTYSISSTDGKTSVSNKELSSGYNKLGTIAINSSIEDVHEYELKITPEDGYGWDKTATDNIVEIVVLFEQAN